MQSIFSIMLVILFYLFWPLLILGIIIGTIVYILRRRSRGGNYIESEWYNKFFLSKEDFVSQFFILFSVILLNIALWIINRELGNLISGTTVFFISSIIGIAVGYYLKAIWTFIPSTIGLVAWWFNQAVIWVTKGTSVSVGGEIFPSSQRAVLTIKPITFISAFIFIAIIFYLLGRIFESKEKYKRLAKFYSFIGIISVTVVLFIFSSDTGIELIGSITDGDSLFNSFEISISFALFLGVLSVMLIYSFKEKLIFFQEAIAIGFLAVFFMIISLLPEQSVYISSYSRYYSNGYSLSVTGIFWAVLLNCLVFLEILGIVFLGYLRRQNVLINLGAVFLFLLIIMKYFDWFGNLAGGAFLIGAGILLFVVGWSMEKGRRYMISKIQNTEIR